MKISKTTCAVGLLVAACFGSITSRFVAARAPQGAVGGGNERPKGVTLADVVKRRPFVEYAKWWSIGETFSWMMSEAILAEWLAVPTNQGDLARVRTYTKEYVSTVYGRSARPGLVDDFVRRDFSSPLQSGEFDSLSYAFFRSAFEMIERRRTPAGGSVETERRLFTRRVGKRFFGALANRLSLDLPPRLVDVASFAKVKEAIRKVMEFLTEQGYFRGPAGFRFDVATKQKARKIDQADGDFVNRLNSGQSAYALFSMSYPAILPSAVYLFEVIGEAQHHSSRTIEELFDRVGCTASETRDFDPGDYASDMVVELWEISARSDKARASRVVDSDQLR